MKYYLLTFNDDYADEHSVPALACFTEEQYQKWLEKPSGEKNENYEQELAAYEKAQEEDKKFWEILTEKGYVLNGSPNTSVIPETDKETLKLEREMRARSHYETGIENPEKVSSHMNAWLGNSGDGFEESYNHLYFMHEFVEEGIVAVLEVPETFYTIFHQAQLDNLSLCNIFDED